jgi:electron transfer flavoprotein beta subunit
MTPGAIFEAWRAREVAVWTLADIEIDPAALGLKGSPTKVKKSFPKATKAAGAVVRQEGAQAAQTIVDKLKQHFII